MSQAQIISDDSGVINASTAQLVSIGSGMTPVEPESSQVGAQTPQPFVGGVSPQQQPDYTAQLAALQAAQQSQPQPPPPPPQQPQQLDEAGQQWWTQFQQYTGLTQEQFSQGVQQLQQLPQIQQFVAQQQKESQLSTLRQEWGNQFDAVMPEVAARFQALPPQLQAALDNVEGARLLYAQIQQEKGLRGPQVPNAIPPQYDRARTPQQRPVGNQQEPQFTRSQIQEMSEADYAKNQSAIMYAYQNGLVR